MTDYDLHAVVATEVELDVLTGEKNVTRVDLLQDVGNSTSPWVMNLAKKSDDFW